MEVVPDVVDCSTANNVEQSGEQEDQENLQAHPTAEVSIPPEMSDAESLGLDLPPEDNNFNDSGDGPTSLKSPVSFPDDKKRSPFASSNGGDNLRKDAKPSRKGQQKEIDPNVPFNPFQLTTSNSVKFHSENVTKALGSTSAVELTVECRDLSRMEMFSKNNIFVALMAQGMKPGTWEEMYRTETVKDTRSPNFIQKFRLPASSEGDRETQYQIHVYNCRIDSEQTLAEMELIGTTQATVAELLLQKQMTSEKSVVSPRSGKRKGSAVLTLDMIQHEDLSEETVFDFGFTPEAPVRNRIFFVISRAIQKGRFSPIYKSEVKVKEDLSKFEDVILTSQELHGGNQGRLFRIEIYRFYLNGTTTLLGFVQTSLEKLKTCDPGAQLYWWPAMSGFTRVGFKIVSSKVDKENGKNWFVMRLCK